VPCSPRSERVRGLQSRVSGFELPRHERPCSCARSRVPFMSRLGDESRVKQYSKLIDGQWHTCCTCTHMPAAAAATDLQGGSQKGGQWYGRAVSQLLCQECRGSSPLRAPRWQPDWYTCVHDTSACPRGISNDQLSSELTVVLVLGGPSVDPVHRCCHYRGRRDHGPSRRPCHEL
jgi:hypothetical protein